jgi:hypothetical protein
MKLKVPNFFDDDEALMDTMGSQLNADAPPFHPMYEPVNLAIFNDGVPSMTLPSEADRAKILHGIEDEAIDENFPPDAEDAAELEEAEAFVLEMAQLALLEEREERARSGFVHIKKRWEVRRAAGPRGRPHPAMNLIVPVDHFPKHQNVKTIVPFSQVHRMMVQEDKMRTHEIKRNVEPRRIKTAVSHRQPIQQPRKQF